MRCVMTPAEIRKHPDRWALARDELVTASDMGSIAGLDDAYSTPFDVYLRKIRHEFKPDSISMRIGRHYEPLVLELFAEANPDLAVVEGGLYRSTEPGRAWQAATFDALAYGKTTQPIPVQAKTCYSFSVTDRHGRRVWGDPPDGEIPGPYLAQCLTEIDVAEADEAFLPVLPTGARGEPRVYRVKRDDSELDALRQVGEWFAECLHAGVAPDISASPIDTRALKRLYRDVEHVDVVIPKLLARRIRAAREAVRRAEARYSLAENEIRRRMGPATAAVVFDGDERDVVATRSVYEQTRVRVPDLRAKHPRIAKRFGYTVPIDKLLVKQPKITP